MADPGALLPDPDWRPSRLTDVYTVDAIRQIMAWFDEMRRYEADAKSKAGSGLKRPGDLVLVEHLVTTPEWLAESTVTGGHADRFRCPSHNWSNTRLSW